ncbi:MAG: DUF2721 domain-containing protein [Chloroflexota bacterium]|nr:DUF2721 domain-containing protein [Chloroflexota bacterium]
MEIDITAPMGLLTAVALLMIVFANRFLAVAALIRSLHQYHQTNPDQLPTEQIHSLRHRVRLIRNMQEFSVLSLLLSIISIFALSAGQVAVGAAAFAAGLVLIMSSLALSVREIRVSINALNVQMRDLEGMIRPSGPP